MAFMLALETLGLSSCPLNWHGSSAQGDAAARILGLQADERIVLMLAVGYMHPEASVLLSGRRDLAAIRRYVPSRTHAP